MHPFDYNSGPKSIEPGHHYDSTGINAGLSALVKGRQKEKVHTVDYALVIPRFALQELVPLKLLI